MADRSYAVGYGKAVPGARRALFPRGLFSSCCPTFLEQVQQRSTPNTQFQIDRSRTASLSPTANLMRLFLERHKHRYSDGEWGLPPFVEVRLPECRTSGPLRNVD